MFQIDVMSRTPVYEQIIDQIERYVVNGLLSSGDQLPSVRSLSMELSVNPNTIQKAYGELDTKGIIASVPGRGCFVAPGARDALCTISRKKLSVIEETACELSGAGVSRDEIISAVDRGIKSVADRAKKG